MSSMLKHEKYTENANFNVGDTFQDLAIDYIFREMNIDEKNVVYVPREGGYSFDNEEEIIMAANIMLFVRSEEKNIPYPDNFHPCFISAKIYHDSFNLYPQLIQYIKKYEPVGCRDEETRQILRSYGIEAYLMGCFTVCFPKREHIPVNGKAFFVDTPKELNAYVPDYLRERAVYISHSMPFLNYPADIEEDARQKKIAQSFLDRYRDEAEIVITGRLHAAVPCMAMGIPVILVRENFDSRFGWIDKYLPLYYLDEAEKIDWHPSVINLEDVKENVISYVKKSLLQIPGREKHLIELDAFYSDRNKTVINKHMREKIDAFFQTTSNNATYGIWGAGIHCKYVQSIIRENYPNAQLKVIIDKHVEGSLFNTPLIKGEQLQKDSFNHMFITTLQGKHEAIAKMKEMYGEKADEFYTLITSEMVC